jgi:hypothetical protein
MLVEVSELIDYMDIKFSPRQSRAAEYVLLGLQSELEAYLRRSLELETVVEEHVVPGDYAMAPTVSFAYDMSLDTTFTGTGSLTQPITVYLRNTPVVSVTGVTVTTPTAASVVPMVQVDGRDYLVRRYGVDLYRVSPNDTVTISYTGGLNGSEINVFRLLILRAASREMQNMHDDVVGLKDLEARNVAPLQTGFTELELKSVKRWRHHKLAG